MRFVGDPHSHEAQRRAPVEVVGAEIVTAPFRRACADLHALTMRNDSDAYVAAGAPWFMTLFGRDTLVTALMTGMLGAEAAIGSLRALAAYQATVPKP